MVGGVEQGEGNEDGGRETEELVVGEREVLGREVEEGERAFEGGGGGQGGMVSEGSQWSNPYFLSADAVSKREASARVEGVGGGGVGGEGVDGEGVGGEGGGGEGVGGERADGDGVGGEGVGGEGVGGDGVGGDGVGGVRVGGEEGDENLSVEEGVAAFSAAISEHAKLIPEKEMADPLRTETPSDDLDGEVEIEELAKGPGQRELTE
ncbi:MAG: hypothetical protein SGPRY_012720 [Prymnesium sp.]